MRDLERIFRKMIRKMIREELQRASTTPQQLRLKAGLSLDELAQRLKDKGFPTCVRQLQRYEAGKAGNDRRVEKRVKAICEVLNCSEAEYFEGIRSEK